jgi:hypothetical protein
VRIDEAGSIDAILHGSWKKSGPGSVPGPDYYFGFSGSGGVCFRGRAGRNEESALSVGLLGERFQPLDGGFDPGVIIGVVGSGPREQDLRARRFLEDEDELRFGGPETFSWAGTGRGL